MTVTLEECDNVCERLRTLFALTYEGTKEIALAQRNKFPSCQCTRRKAGFIVIKAVHNIVDKFLWEEDGYPTR